MSSSFRTLWVTPGPINHLSFPISPLRLHEYDIADLPGHSVPEGETRKTRITKGYARAIPQRLVDAVNGVEEGKRIIVEGWRREAAAG